jgi:hypothetical protein
LPPGENFLPSSAHEFLKLELLFPGEFFDYPFRMGGEPRVISPGNANLPIGAVQIANREIGVPGFHPIHASGLIPWADEFILLPRLYPDLAIC